MEINHVEKFIVASSDLDEMNIFRCPTDGIYAKNKSLNDNCFTCGKAIAINITEDVRPFQSTFRDELGDGPWNLEK